MRKSICIFVAGIVLIIAMAHTVSFATIAEDIPIAAEYNLDEMMLDVTAPLENNALHQAADGYVNGSLVEEVLTKHLFQLSWMDELVLHPEGWERDALAHDAFVDMLRAVVREELPDFYDDFAFGIYSLSDGMKPFPLLIDSANGFMTYQEAVVTLREIYHLLHFEIGVQEDRSAYTTRREFLGMVRGVFPEWTPDDQIVWWYDRDITLVPLDVAELFEVLAEQLLAVDVFERIDYEFSLYDWMFGIEDGIHPVRLNRAAQSGILPEELNAAVARYVDFINQRTAATNTTMVRGLTLLMWLGYSCCTQLSE